MTWKVIEKKQLQSLIEELAREYDVFAPVKRKDIVSFERLVSEDKPCLDFRNSKKPPKDMFLPQTETLFTYRPGKKEMELANVPIVDRKRLLLGVRPCDARSFVLADKFLSMGEHEDSYLERRKATIVLGLACNAPLTTCFCTSMGGKPFGKDGIDVLLQDVDDKFLMETVTEKGKELVEKISWLKDAEQADIEKAKGLSETAEGSLRPEFSVKDVSKNLDGMFDDAFWSQVSRKCLGCGICTFLCPTCCCFDILDEETEEKRVRIWDSCQFPFFTLQGSGHNPRPSEKERLRQRIMHKFNYSVKNYGENFCVGCGRCVQECPVNLDIRDIARTISSKQAE